MERPRIFTTVHAIVAHGKRVRVQEDTPFFVVDAGNEVAGIRIDLDRDAAEALYRDLEAKLFLSELRNDDAAVA